MYEPKFSNRGPIIECTSGGALSMSSNTVQTPFCSACITSDQKNSYSYKLDGDRKGRED